MNEITYTREQQVAMYADRHLAVTANAGSGKTQVLVNRYIGLIINDKEAYRQHDPRKILAITFTRKAAAEMLAKVVREIEAMIQSAEEAAEIRKLKSIRDRLSVARISTIHSFCSSLLRDFPIEADVSPNFIELTESELAAIKSDAIRYVAEDWLEADDDRKTKAQSLFAEFGIKSVEDTIEYLISNTETLYVLKQSEKDESIDEAVNRHHARFIDYINSSINSFAGDLFSILGVTSGEGIKENDKIKVEEAKLKFNNYIADFNGNIPKTMVELGRTVEKFNFVLDNIFTQDGKLRALFKKCLPDNLADKAVSILKNSPLNKEIAAVIQSSQYSGKMLELSNTFIELSEEVLKRIAEQKQVLGGLDFDDLLIKTDKLLKIDSVRDRFCEGLRHVLVDEFQDTNQLQYNLVRSLIRSLGSSAADSSGRLTTRLFIVGDAKQSIYGFRNADVRVFEKAVKDIEKANVRLSGKNIFDDMESQTQLSNDENTGSVKLHATFRLLPIVSAFINKVCGNLMAGGASEFDVRYDEFVNGRSGGSFPIAESQGDRQPISDSFGSVRFLFSVKEYGKNDPDISEAELIVRQIKTIVYGTNNDNSKIEINSKVNSKNIIKKPDGSSYNFNDFAILSRKKKSFNELSEAFLQHGIPFVVSSGGGFFESQEIIDIISYLKFLYNQNDDIAVAATLKSPFFCLNDTALFEIRRNSGKGSYWERFCSYANNQGSSNEMVRFAYDTLNKMISLAPRLPVSQLIMSILENSLWYGIYAGAGISGQVDSNLDKLIGLARDFERRGFRNFNDFARELELMSKTSGEGEAAFSNLSDAVNIMTIHAAKGLEFPIVILYNSNFKSKNDAGPILDIDYGLSLPTPVSLAASSSVVNISEPIHFMASLRNKFADIAEEKRILYVAMSRAKDHLIISGNINKTKTGKFAATSGHLSLLFESLGIDLNVLDLSEANGNQIIENRIRENGISEDQINESQINESQNNEVVIDDEIQLLHGGGIVSSRIKYAIKFCSYIEDIQVKMQKDKAVIANSPILLQDIESGPDSEYFSASKLMQFKANIENYRQKYIYGFPDSAEKKLLAPRLPDEQENDSVSGTLYGSLLHRAMELSSTWVERTGAVNLIELNRIIASENFRFERELTDDLKLRLLAECPNIINTKLVQQNMDGFLSAATELNLTIPYGDDFLTGSMDMLIKNVDGNYEIWDWKTNYLPFPAKMSKYAESYKMQLQVYAYFTMLLHPDQQIFPARLLFTKLARPNAGDDEWTHLYQWDRGEVENFLIELSAGVDSIREIL